MTNRRARRFRAGGFPLLELPVHFFLLVGLTTVLGAPSVAANGHVQAPSAGQTHWIWVDAERQPETTAFFRREFSSDRPITSATLRAIGESASLDVYLDGAFVVELDPYDPLIRLDVTERLTTGKHVLAVRSRSCQGPAAIALRLDLTFDDNSRRTLASNPNWSATENRSANWNSPSFKPTGWRRAVAFGAVSENILLPQSRQVGITAVDDYEQWRQALGAKQGADPASFRTSPGFEIELVRSAQADEDSWVSLAFDPQGRAVIAKEKAGLLRMSLSDDGRRITKVESINDELKECRGLLFAHGDLFVNANNSKGLYRLRKNDRDRFDEPRLLYASTGGVGHGRNDLALGPDGKIYMIHGDSVDLPQKCIDHTSPFRAARRGKKTSEGHLLRIDPEGGTVEVLAAGLRNPFGVDFNSDGEAFTYDADAEYDMGAPWYRPTRVVHLVTGGDFGWRGVTKSWPSYYPDHPDNALPNLDIGKGSPTAVKFGARSNFPGRYRAALFILDWAYGRIIAVRSTPRGASYLMTAEEFLKGRPLNVTDLDFGRDGSMYLVTGGRGTRSALYRIRHVAEPPSEKKEAFAAAETRQQRARRQFARSSRKLRRQLESRLTRDLDDDGLDAAWRQLSNDDPWIRHAARNVIERAGVDRWRKKALEETNRTASLTAILALARSGDKEARPRILARLNEVDWQRGARAERLAALYAYQLCLSPSGGLSTRLRDSVAARLRSVYPDRAYPVNRLLSELLAGLGDVESIAATVELMSSTENQAEQMHYLYVLRHVKQGWTLDDRKRYFQTMSQSNAYLGGAGMRDFLDKIRREALATLGAAERQALASIIERKPEAAETIEAPSRPFVRKWTVEELSARLKEVGEGRDLKRGEAVFAATSCVKCHRIRGRGTLVGPDLTSVRSRFSRRDLLESIINPSKVVPEKYRSLQVITKSGKTFTGQPASGGDYRSPKLRLAVDPLRPFKITEILKSDIEVRRLSANSWMPVGLLDTLTGPEILDLLAYIEAGGETGSETGGDSRR